MEQLLIMRVPRQTIFSEGLLEASLGFITIVPDYIGFGAIYNSDPSVRIHPYIIAKSYASDGVNMMTAAKSALEAHGITLGAYTSKDIPKEAMRHLPFNVK